MVQGDERQSKVGHEADTAFLKILTEELGIDYKERLSNDEVSDALDNGCIEINGGQTEIYITWPEKTINADKE